MLKSIFLIFFLEVIIYIPVAYADNKSDVKEIIYNPIDDYRQEDKLLNEAFKALLTQLDNKNKILLKKSQRSWIKWRDETCLRGQAKADKQIGALGSSVRDDCLVTLTERRAEELTRFANNPSSALQNQFAFERNVGY